MTQMLIFHRLGFIRLLGIGHIYWIPMLAWLWPHDYSTGMDAGFIRHAVKPRPSGRGYKA